MKIVVLIVAGLVSALLVAGPSFVTGAPDDKIPFPEVPRITKEQLREHAGKTGCNDYRRASCGAVEVQRPDNPWHRT